MPFNLGTFNELEIINAINNKKVYEIPQNLKYVIYLIFGELDNEAIIHSERIDGFIKPDIFIEYKGVKKYVSIKSGRATEVHAEYAETFVPFLRENGMSKESAEFLLKYCYADGTIDGSGEKAMDFLTLKTTYQKESKKFNRELLDNPDLVIKVIDRCLFEGSRPDRPAADYLYFGSVEYGLLVSRNQIKKHLLKKSWAFMDNPHIGPLQFRMHTRGKSKCEEYEYKRHTVDLWWANLRADIEFISKRYNIR